MANDDELAELMLDQPQGDTAPRLAEYTPEVARLDALLDKLGELISVTVQVAGNKAPRMRPARRPETALSRALRHRSEQKVADLIAEVEAAQQRLAPPNTTE